MKRILRTTIIALAIPMAAFGIAFLAIPKYPEEWSNVTPRKHISDYGHITWKKVKLSRYMTWAKMEHLGYNYSWTIVVDTDIDRFVKRVIIYSRSDLISWFNRSIEK